VMKLLLDGDLPVLEVLRQQYAASSIRSREFSGVGFFSHFAVPKDVAASSPPDFELGDVGLELRGVRNGAGVLLFVRHGYLQLLEGFTYDDPWPENPEVEDLHYLVTGSSGSSERSRTRSIENVVKRLGRDQ